jgi:hypothetical protein
LVTTALHWAPREGWGSNWLIWGVHHGFLLPPLLTPSRQPCSFNRHSRRKLYRRTLLQARGRVHVKNRDMHRFTPCTIPGLNYTPWKSCIRLHHCVTVSSMSNVPITFYAQKRVADGCIWGLVTLIRPIPHWTYLQNSPNVNDNLSRLCW